MAVGECRPKSRAGLDEGVLPTFFQCLHGFSKALGEQSPYVALDFATGCDHELEDVAVGYVHWIADRQYVAVRLLAQGSSLALHDDFAQLCRLMVQLEFVTGSSGFEVKD